MKTDLEPIPSLQPKFVSAKVGDLEPNGAHHNLQDSGPKWPFREGGEMVHRNLVIKGSDAPLQDSNIHDALSFGRGLSNLTIHQRLASEFVDWE